MSGAEIMDLLIFQRIIIQLKIPGIRSSSPDGENWMNTPIRTALSKQEAIQERLNKYTISRLM